MYQPPHFAADQAAALGLMAEHPFATLLAFAADGTPFVSHLPLLIAAGADGGGLRLLGHMARANPQWQQYSDRPQATALFQGPHTYVTPKWYAQHDVPTWNYAVVHAHGSVRLLEGHRETVRVLTALTERFEGTGPDAWRFALPSDLAGPGELTKAIVAFELQVDRLEAKFKLSQNRSASDRAGVARGLAGRQDDLSRGVLAMMAKDG